MPFEPSDGYQVGYKKPPKETRFKKGNNANPHGRPRSSKTLASMLDRALDAPVEVEEGGARRKMTKRDVVIAQLVDRSAGADLRATKILLDMLHKLERSSAPAGPVAEEDVYAQLREKLARLALAQEAEATAARDPVPSRPEGGEGEAGQGEQAVAESGTE
jgi:uncharacterized protein DUF5681